VQLRGHTKVTKVIKNSDKINVKSSVKFSVKDRVKNSVKNRVKGSVKKELTCASPFSASPSDAMDSSNLSLHAPSLLNHHHM